MEIIKTPVHQRTLFFEGNSLMNQDIGSTLAVFGYYVPKNIYENIRVLTRIGYSCLAISGRTQTQINASLATNITPYAKAGDIIFLWEGTNDITVNNLTAAQAWDNVVTYINTVIPLGVTLVIATVLARDYATDPASVMDTDIPAYNTLVRNNAAIYGYTVCDLAADPLFDQRSDCSNSTYYNADKLHQNTSGQAQVISLATTTITSVL